MTLASTPPAPRLVRRGRGIGTRLALLAAGLLLVTSGAGGGLLLEGMAHTYRQEARERAAALLGSLAVPCAMALSVNALERLDDYLAEVVRAGEPHMGMRHVAMLDVEGAVIAHASVDPDRRVAGLPAVDSFERRAVRSPLALWEVVGTPDTPTLSMSTPAVSGLRWGTLVATFDLRAVEADIGLVRRILVAVGLGFAGAIAVTLYLGLSRMVVFPLHKLAGAAEAIEAGHLDARAELTQDDELGRLAETFNSMARQIQSWTQDLERKVQERSAEVQRKNDELIALNARLQEAVDALARLARVDALTNVHNRRHFVESLESLVGHAPAAEEAAPAEPPANEPAADAAATQAGPREPVSLLMLDVDFFKRLNDRFGHLAGDAVLKQVAAALQGHMRQSDVLARYGGEEFAVILPGTTRVGAVDVAERLRQAIAQADFGATPVGPIGQVTVSVGVACHPQDAGTPRDLIDRADQSLYAAKSAGRNCVVAWLGGGPGPKAAPQA
ncbi:MAG: diguanylate cyclase [Myxococcales bacterium]|nr:diguanylate cyclase [Myxococcales bacterium]